METRPPSRSGTEWRIPGSNRGDLKAKGFSATSTHLGMQLMPGGCSVSDQTVTARRDLLAPERAWAESWLTYLGTRRG